MVTGVLITSGCLFLGGIVLPVVQRAVERGRRRDEVFPTGGAGSSVDIVIAAYLESSVIGATISRLQGQLSANGVLGRVIVVASDEETFKAASAADATLLVPRNGKPAAINAGVAASSADVVVLTDANCEIQPDDWPRRVLRGLAHAHLVTGSKRERGSRESLFWKYEAMLKSKGEGAEATLAVVGEFLAFRRSDFAKIPEASLADDLALALDFNRRNLRVAAVPGLITIEDPASPREQWERRVRIVCGLLSEAVPRIPQLFGSSVGRIYLAHKIYRVTIGAAAFWVAVVSAIVAFPVYGPFLIGGTVLWSLLRYTGIVGLKTPVDPVLDAIAMQAIPVAGLWRIVVRKFRTGITPGWVKVPR